MDQELNNKQISKKSILIIIFTILVVTIVGTYAWLTYQSSKTAMVLTIGDIDSVQIQLSPYQINGSLDPLSDGDYTKGIVTNVTATNTSAYSKKFSLYYQIDTIDSSLITSDFKYTIVRTNDSVISSGNFSTASSNSDMTILTQSIPANTTYTYNVYLWIDGYTNPNASGGTFEGELRASILNHIVTFDANGGTTPVSSMEVTYGEAYGSLPTPTRDGYTFLGWHGINEYNVRNTKSVASGYTRDTDDYINLNTSSGVHYYNYWTKNLDIPQDTAFTIVLEVGNTANLSSGTLYVTSSNSGEVGQFYGKSFSYSKLIPGSIHVYDANTRTGVNQNYGLRTYFNNSGYATNISLAFRISVMYQNPTITSNNFLYEPYYITNTTTVVQNKDHTLTAIWQAN